MSSAEIVLQHVMLLLKKDKLPTRDIIRTKIRLAAGMLEQAGEEIDFDEEEMIRDIEGLLAIWTPKHTELVDPTGHEQWLDDWRGKITWGFWKRYEQYLEQVKKLPPGPLQKVHEMTDAVLEKLEHPEREGPWDRRGMVVGQVQSGKTSNYTGLICKAADAGYKLIVVLAGMHNSLRSQTQYRLDEGFLGRDTQRERAFSSSSHRMGAGHIPTRHLLAAHSMTSSAENGDFRTNQVGGTTLGGNPVLVVVKKNRSILNNLLQWALSVAGETDPVTGKRVVRGIPLLVIDDEADNASVNTKNSEEDVTAINGCIRKLLHAFEKSAYVGYTATPFANIFIYPEAETEEYGPDLFPRSFILNLPAPSNYIGPAQVFGLAEDQDAGIEAITGLPIVKPVDDYEELIPSQHKRDHEVGSLPDSLEYAIKAFILSGAARIARGQGSEHHSMLIHVTRFIDVQKQVEEQVKLELGRLQKRIAYGDGRMKGVMDEFREMWENDFVPTTRRIRRQTSDKAVREMEWDTVKERLYDAVMKIRVKLINGSANDVLDYVDHKNGLSVIAIGGDKLSRGLTLEGLSVSYYLRGSRMYDTLMQMGRWFGYRPGYVDLCRLYTSPELITWYKHIAAASEELRLEFDFMAQTGRTPNDYGLKVRTHPAGLVITGAGKMKHGTKMRLTFADTLTETTVFHKSAPAIGRRNYEAAEQFLKGLGPVSETKRRSYLWRDVPAARLMVYLNGAVGHPESRRSDPRMLREYIEKQVEIGELTHWTVALISTQQQEDTAVIAGIPVGLTRRSNETPDSPDKYKMIRDHIISPQDEMLDLTPEQEAEAMRLTAEAWAKREKKGEPKAPSGPAIRSVRSVRNGLLMLYPLSPDGIDPQQQVPFFGYALSFPASVNAKATEYMVNNVYWKEEFEAE